MDPRAPLLQVARMVVGLIPRLVLDPRVGLLFWFVVGFVYLQAVRVGALERTLYGRAINPPLRRTASAAGYGLVAGLAGSLTLALLGIPLGPTDVGYVWPLALLLLLVNPRLLCFAYAGGLLALARLAFGWPPVHVTGLLGLVAVLHLVEGVLVALDGEKIVTPLYVRHRPGQVVGGFFVQRFWPVPLVVVLFLPGAAAAGGISMPDWWPLVFPDPGVRPPADTVFLLLPVAGALGYGDIALTRPARAKSLRTAGLLVVYASVLLALTVLGSRQPAWLWLAAAFAPGAHEWLARHGGAVERRGRAAFVPHPDGVRVLDVLPGSPAERLGIRSGDVVRAVNGQPVRSRAELVSALDAAGLFVALDVEGREGARELEWTGLRGGAAGFGLVAVPDPGDVPHADLTRRRPWMAVAGWLARLRRPPRADR
jgi:hypothetical protein